MSKRSRWQLVSNDSVWMFPADIQLSTVELPTIMLSELFNEQFESCLFFINGNSEVIARYATQEDAIKGHELFEKEYGLRRCEKLKI